MIKHKNIFNTISLNYAVLELVDCAGLSERPTGLSPFVGHLRSLIKLKCSTYEPPHDKTNRMTVRPAKTQISVGIHPVWSVFAVRSMVS